MKCIISINIILLLWVTVSLEALAAPAESTLSNKIFNYQGAMPIKDDRTGQLLTEDIDSANATPSPMSEQEQSEAEAACWKLINEQSVVTFALQGKVLDDLKAEMEKLTMKDEARLAIEKIINRMRQNMRDALEALKRDAADEYFDSLFETSEDIIYLSILLRDPKLDDSIFLTLVKAVSRLGRNNSALIQEFTDMCSFIQRSPRPRVATATASSSS